MTTWAEQCAGGAHACPRNGTLNGYIQQASHALTAHGIVRYPRIPETILWANDDSEYPGAVTMLRDELREAGLWTPLARYAPLTGPDVLAFLDDAVRMARSGRPPPRGEGHTSLSGQRPKIGLSLTPQGDRRVAPKGHLNTWVVKVEDSPATQAKRGIVFRDNQDENVATIKMRKPMSRDWGGRA